MKLFHVDVFSDTPFAGNGLTVVLPETMLSANIMQQIAFEFKQFETIFLLQEKEDTFTARIFTVEEELDFAGHPILGACAVIHQEFFPLNTMKEITFRLNTKSVTTTSKKINQHYQVTMNQGVPKWGSVVSSVWQKKYCKALNLSPDDLCPDYPMEVVSTGLPYLLVPLQKNLANAHIQVTNLEALLQKNGAKFVYLFDVKEMEGRTWDNLGAVEDVATGSAAGPMGAYLYQHGCFKPEELIHINQGQYVGRPSLLTVSKETATGAILVSGDVAMVARGEL